MSAHGEPVEPCGLRGSWLCLWLELQRDAVQVKRKARPRRRDDNTARQTDGHQREGQPHSPHRLRDRKRSARRRRHRDVATANAGQASRRPVSSPPDAAPDAIANATARAAPAMLSCTRTPPSRIAELTSIAGTSVRAIKPPNWTPCMSDSFPRTREDASYAHPNVTPVTGRTGDRGAVASRSEE